MQRRKLFDYSNVPRRQQAYILAAMLFWSVLFYLGVSKLGLHGIEVSGPSMEPTLHDGERRVAHLWWKRMRGLTRGNVVALKVPWDDALYVKRIVALPGEVVCIRDGTVQVNRERLDEIYLPSGLETDGGYLEGKTMEVASDCFFVLGDNRSHSTDSRDFGAVRKEWIIGVIL